MPRQDPTTSQLLDVSRAAVEMGCYVADDIIKQHLRNHDEGQRYFKMESGVYRRLSEAFWSLEDTLGQPRTTLKCSFIGVEGSVWTESLSAQRLLRAMLLHMEVQFEESDTQQVTSIFDGFIR